MLTFFVVTERSDMEQGNKRNVRRIFHIFNNYKNCVSFIDNLFISESVDSTDEINIEN